ncbi:MAG: zinc-dependent metalloprotease [Phycisphaerae bacterium]|nr:zinc-dependent metalloprotease [Phycisphaerae bacterium]
MLRLRISTALLFLSLTGWLSAPALADPNPSDHPGDVHSMAVDIAALLAQAEAISPAGKDPEQSKADYNEVIKDMEVVNMTPEDSLLKIWRYPRGKRDKDQEKVLCEVPARFLGERFMLSTSVAGGSYLFGFPLNERAVFWKVQGDHLLLVEPQTRFIVDGKTPVRAAVERTHPDLILASVPVLAKKPSDDSPVFDLGALLKSDFADIGWLAPRGMARIIPQNSTFEKIKPFPQNVEVAVKLAVSQPQPPGSYSEIGVHYSFWALPETDYSPRIADSRVGYFLTTHQDWSVDVEARDLWKRYVDRWQLEKRDSSLARSEPKEPIIFYIEHTWPVAYREAARAGILEWNKAFEKVGILNAIQVRQQEVDNEWSEIDLEDMRYSGLRWITTGWAFAMGPHRSNPFTGQIYDADILFDDSMVRAFSQEGDLFSPEAMLAPRLADEGLKLFWDKFPDMKPRFLARSAEWPVGIDTKGRTDPGVLFDRYRERHPFGHACGLMQGMQSQMRFAGAVLCSKPPEVRERLLQDAIKETVAHEVGHALGLRHNFAASTVYALEEIPERAREGKATSGSVMDYLPLMFGHDGEGEGHFSTPTIGPWDYWAIAYGYQPFDQSYKPAKNDKEELSAKSAESDRNSKASDDIRLPPEMEQAMAAVPAERREAVRQALLKAGVAKIVDTSKDKDKEPAATPPSGEEGMLKEIASRASQPGLVYQTDEDTTIFGIDPRANLWDLGQDPFDFAEQRMVLVKKRLGNFLEWAVKDGESWEFARSSLLTLMLEKVRVIDYVGRLIGGQQVSRAHRGDPSAPTPYVMIPRERQEKALRFIAENLYDDDFFDVDPDVLKHLTPSRWSHQGAWVSLNVEFPYYAYVAFFQWWNLFDRLFPPTLERIHDAEVKSDPEDRFTISAYLQALQAACWEPSLDAQRAADSGKWGDTRPFIPGVRRSLQREYLNLMEQLVQYRPGVVLSPDLHAMVRQVLLDLKGDVERVLAVDGLDFPSRAHLESCRFRIDAVLNPKFQERGLW